MAVTDWSGAAIQINSYDEYGAPAPGNAGRFGYTGQVWLPETGLYHYKARAYHPELGRFMQTDPIGVNGGMNLYAYVGGDPVNYTDPLGLKQEDQWECEHPDPIWGCQTSRSTVPGSRNLCPAGWTCMTINALRDLFGGPNPSPFADYAGYHDGVGVDFEGEVDCLQGFVDVANGLSVVEELSGGLSDNLGLLGVGTTTAAIFAGPLAPEVAAAGGTLIAASGFFGAISVTASIGAEGTAGFATGRYEGAANAIVGWGLAKLIDRAVRYGNGVVPGVAKAHNLASSLQGYQPARQRTVYSCEN